MDHRRLHRGRIIIACFLATSFLGTPLVSLAGARTDNNAPLDPAEIVVTSSDLSELGFTGYRLQQSNDYGLDDDVEYLSTMQKLTPDDVRSTLANAGYLDDFSQNYVLPADSKDPQRHPLREFSTGVYSFADAKGAESAYTLFTDESHIPNVAADVPNTGRNLGDQSELTVIRVARDNRFHLPMTRLELEIRVDRFVIEISSYNYDPESPAKERAELAKIPNLLSVGDLMVDRANDAINGDAPNLASLAIELETDVYQPSYRTYTLYRGQGNQNMYQTDQDSRKQIEREIDRGTASAFEQEQLLTNPNNLEGTIRFYTTAMRFGSQQDAVDYMQKVEQRLDASPGQTADLISTPELGDEAMIFSLTTEDDSETQTLSELFIRSGDIVMIMKVGNDLYPERMPEVPPETLTTLGSYQAECLEGRSCDATFPIPEGLVRILDDFQK